MSQFPQYIDTVTAEPRNFGLLFLSAGEEEEEEYPMADPGASAEIYLRSFTRAEYDKVTVTLRCGTINDFEQEVDRLHKELEHLRELARRKFAEMGKLEKSA